MKTFLQTVFEECSKTGNKDIDYIMHEAEDALATLPQGPSIPVSPEMVIVVKREPTDDCQAKYLIDYNTLLRLAQSTQQTLPAAFDQVVEKNCIPKAEAAVAIQDIDIERSKKEIINSETDSVRESKIAAVLDYSQVINTFMENEIGLVRCK